MHIKEKVNVIADEIKSLQKQRAEYLRTENQKQVEMTDFEIRKKRKCFRIWTRYFKLYWKNEF